MKPLHIYLGFNNVMRDSMGIEVPGSTEVVKSLQKVGHKIILNSSLADLYNKEDLEYALDWLRNRKVIIDTFSVSKRQPQPFTLPLNQFIIHTDPIDGGYIYIDSKSLNTPLLFGIVNWTKVASILQENDVFNVT
jgi:hypothetical protein